jgi:hypothetical protein
MGDFFDGLLRRREADAHGRARGERFQPLQRKGEMDAALVVGHGVNFVHNHSLNITQDGAALFRREQDVERLGRGDQNMRRAPQHQAPVFHQSIAGAHGGADLRHQKAALARHLQNFSQRDFKIFLDVVAEGFERGDVKNLSAVVQIACEGFADEAIDAGEESG